MTRKERRRLQRRQRRKERAERREMARMLGRQPVEMDLAVHEVELYNRHLKPAGRPALSYGQYFGQVRLGRIVSPYGRQG